MKICALTALLIGVVFFSFGQNQRQISYFDERGRLTYEESAFYYRENTDTINYYKSYYNNKNHIKYFEGFIVNALDTADYNNKYSGLCKWFYPNGNLKIYAEYNNNGLLNGVKSEYSFRGFLVKQTVYENGKISNKRHLEFDSTGVSYNVFNEEFTDNLFGWPVFSEIKQSSKIKTGGLEIINNTEKKSYILKSLKLDSTNYSIETFINSMYLLPETQTGIVYGYRDTNNYNFFYITKNQFSVGFVKDGKLYNSINNFFTPDLITHNKLKIMTIKDSTYFFINNKLQTYCNSSNLLGDEIGFYVNKGNSFIENLIIKEGKVALNISDNSIMSYKLNGQKKTVNNIYSGVIISKSGVILTEIKNLNKVNKILVEFLVRDTLKLFEADIIKNDYLSNYTLLKIKNFEKLADTMELFYNYHPLKTLTLEMKSNAYYFGVDSLTQKFSSKIIEIKLTKHKNFIPNNIVITNDYLPTGSSIFDVDGNILGIISNVDKKIKINYTPISSIYGYLITKPELIDLVYKKDFDINKFKQNVFKNIVVIKTL